MYISVCKVGQVRSEFNPDIMLFKAWGLVSKAFLLMFYYRCTRL